MGDREEAEGVDTVVVVEEAEQAEEADEVDMEVEDTKADQTISTTRVKAKNAISDQQSLNLSGRTSPSQLKAHPKRLLSEESDL